MPKSTKPQNTNKKPKTVYAIHPWECRHQQYHSEITAYVEASGEWETVAVLRPTTGATAEDLATFICQIINDHQNNKNLLIAAMDALELCLEEATLTFSSEQAADSVIHRIKSRVKG